MDGPLPTTIIDAKTDISMSFDPRSLDSHQTVRLFADAMSVVANRRELPRAAGIVENAAQAPIPNTEAQANEKINELNNMARAAHSMVLQSITKSAVNSVLIDQPLKVAQPENIQAGLNKVE